MNLIFERKLIYKPQQPAEKLSYKLQYICNRRFDDYSVDLIGNCRPDGSFELTNKWGFTEKEWIENRQAYLSGGLRQEGDAPMVEVRLRPNVLFTVLFYLGVFLLLLELLGLQVLPFLGKHWRVGLLACFQLSVMVLIVRATKKLQLRFERLMQLN